MLIKYSHLFLYSFFYPTQAEPCNFIKTKKSSKNKRVNRNFMDRKIHENNISDLFLAAILGGSRKAPIKIKVFA